MRNWTTVDIWKPPHTPNPTTAKKRRRSGVPTTSEQAQRLALAVAKRQFGTRRAEQARAATVRREWGHILRRDRAHLLHAMNPWAPKRWAECVGQAIGEASFEDEPVFVTVIDDAWNHGTYPVWPTPSDLRSFMKEARKRARSLFRGLPYLFFADVGLRQIAGHFAMRVEFHIHGLVWAPLAKLRATADRQGTVENGATRLKVKRARTLDTLLEYCTKDPRIGYHSYPPRRAYSGDRWSHYRLKFAPRHLFALLNLYGDLTQPELTSASGSAAKVLMRARQFAKAQRWPGIRRVRSRAEPRL